MKKRILIVIIGIVIIIITYLGIEMLEFGKGVQDDIHKNEIEREEKPTVKLTKFKNGRWLSTADSLSGIEIKNGKWIMFYKGVKTESSDMYDYTIRKEDRKELGNEYKYSEFLILSNDSDTLEYKILGYSDDFMSLIYTPRGNTLIYVPEKKGIQTSPNTNINQPKTDGNSENIVLATKHCLINKIVIENGKKYVVADYVDFLIGDKAIEKAKENGDADYDISEKGDTLYFVNNDYYVSNVNPKLRTLELDDNVKIEIWDYFKSNGVFKIVNINELQKYLSTKPIMILKIRNGIVMEMREQFVP
ncbi:hypothetical protein BTO06_10285 [Tenacibaculum sp. SZ-18]|uniref:hypothetical protein n=1 Tax=Tenacibaculum sp. SZ-18 TaxID=754423 RepID=UPI000C2D34B5|nr:hypothetical protein [Tenacibaculum sp. SZ-18]AUC15504.1 hypothetical protein BTO06_10285 [Tenacibaculum sp. SZ-18]